MKCLVINLDRSVERLAHVTSEFARIAVPFDRVPAVDAAARPPVHAQSLTPAEIGCFLSHRICWQIIADGADRYGAIFEDDVIFSGNAGLLLSDDGWVPGDADLVKLETYFTRVRMKRQLFAIGNGYSVARLVGEHVGSAGYLVSRIAARKLLQRTERLKSVVDHVLFSPTFLTCSLNTIYQLTPALCAQTQFFPGNDILPTLIQIDPPHRQKPLIERALGEASRTVAHFRNRSFLGTKKVPVVEFRHPSLRQPSNAPIPSLPA